MKDVAGLEFPPHSEIPTENMKPEDILKNEVKHTTYECNDKNGVSNEIILFLFIYYKL